MYKKEIYQDKSKKEEWRWRVIASNGKNIGSSDEGFTRESTAVDNMNILANALFEGTHSYEHMRYAIIGMMSFHLKSSPEFYRTNAELCIKFMEQNQLALNFPNAENFILQRIKDYRKGVRKNIIGPDEIKKEVVETDDD